MPRKKNKTWFNKYWIVTETWTKAFFISHTIGWICAWIQTVWILAAIKRKK